MISNNAECLYVESDQLEERLNTLSLTKDGILAIRDMAHSHRLGAGHLMAKNAPGSLAYHYGVEAVREQFVGQHWRLDRTGGIEGIINIESKIRVAFQNVDVACQYYTTPKPISEKGAGAERACEDNLFARNGVHAPIVNSSVIRKSRIYFIMVDLRGAVEVSMPVVKSGKYVDFVERIFVSDGSDYGLIESAKSLPSPVDDFNVNISRR